MPESTSPRRASAGPLAWLGALAGTALRVGAALLAAVMMIGALLAGALLAFGVLAWALLRGRRLPSFGRAGRPPAPPPGEVIDIEVREVAEAGAPATPPLEGPPD
jgi:hypothetical protein